MNTRDFLLNVVNEYFFMHTLPHSAYEEVEISELPEWFQVGFEAAVEEAANSPEPTCVGFTRGSGGFWSGTWIVYSPEDASRETECRPEFRFRVDGDGLEGLIERFSK